MKRSKEPMSKEKKCLCPYCEEELIISVLPYCQPCSVTLRYCIKCRKPLPRENKVCPHCGAEI